jgi:hypothetical protein
MLLVNTFTLEFEEFIGEPPAYAILSHTWGKDEVSYHGFTDISARIQKAGFEKIRLTCQQAQRDSLEYAWIDTCCIDKASSSQLSEAINSMFKWYQKATKCYVYLDDVQPQEASQILDSELEGSRWFKRGWTLQELIAPARVEFFSKG